jgi:hypothetical protein
MLVPLTTVLDAIGDGGLTRGATGAGFGLKPFTG